MIPSDSIPFNGVGYLPAPSGHPAPQIYLCPYHPVFENDRKGSVAFRDEDDESKNTPYTFTPMKPQYWNSWTAIGWEDCEVGHGWVSACTPDGERFSWEVRLQHDGNPQLEFWGACFGEAFHALESTK